MDIAFLSWIQTWRAPALDACFQSVTYFGEEVLLIAVVCFVYWCLNKRLAQYILFNFFLGGLANAALKITFCTPRPWVRDPSLIPVESARHGASGFSFPSGHTASAMAMYGALAMYAKKRWVTVCCSALILLVGFSRLYLGVHAPQDVLVSMVIGAVMLLVMRRMFDWIDSDPKAEPIVFWVGIALGAALLCYAQYKPYPNMEGTEKLVLDTFKVGGAALGLFCGWRFERRFVRFETKTCALQQLVKYLLGMTAVGGILVFKAPSAVFGDRAWAACQYGLLAFVALGLWPLVFSKYLDRNARLSHPAKRGG